MQKILALILLIVWVYLTLIFVSPVAANNIWEKIWLLEFNKKLTLVKENVEDFILNFDVMWKFSKTKNDALEIKQNVETQITETKQKIETIQTNVEKTTKAIQDTTKAVNNTVDSLWELQKSILDIVPLSQTWDVNTWVTSTWTKN